MAAIAADVKVAIPPVKRADIIELVISLDLELFVKVFKTPNVIPKEPKFENPQRAYVAIKVPLFDISL